MSGRLSNGLSIPQDRALRDAAAGKLRRDPIGWFGLGRGNRRYGGKTLYSLFERGLIAPGDGWVAGRKRMDITDAGRSLIEGR